TLDLVDVGLLHPLEELAGVGGQRLDIAALPLRIDRVEGERRLPGPADAREDDELAVRQRHVDVFQVVRARAADDERAARRVFGVGHPTVVNFGETVREEWYYRGSATASARVFLTTATANAASSPATATAPPTSNSRAVSGPIDTCGSRSSAMAPAARMMRSSVGPMPPTDILKTPCTAVARNTSPATSR